MRGRELPFDDASLDELSQCERESIAQHWAKRARSELTVGTTFGALARVLETHGAAEIVVRELERSAIEEARHSSVCVRLAEAYGRSTMKAPQLEEIALPRFGFSDQRIESMLLVAGTCCVNETIATAWIEACLNAATSALAIEANRLHLRDEIGHARLGWAHLASSAVTGAMRATLSECLPKLLDANVRLWEKDDAFLPREGIASHGHLSVEASRAVVRATVRDVVIPGFAHVGADTQAAREWFERHVSES